MTSTENTVGIREADEPKPLPAVAIDRLREMQRWMLVSDSANFTLANSVAKEHSADLRSLITAYESQAERLREVEGAVVGDDELVADIDVAIGDSLDQGWLTRDGARAVVSMFKAYGWSVVRGVEQ